MSKAALIELVGEDGGFPVSGIGYAESEGIKLGEDPEEIFDTAFEMSTVPKSIGGRRGRIDVPPRRSVLTFNLSDTGQGIEATISRFRRLWISKLGPRRVQWLYTSEESGTRWLHYYADKAIKFSPKRDWNLDGYARAVVSAVALEPRYESAPHEVKTPAHSGGSATYWLPAWNPTDQVGWLEWALKPNGAAAFGVPDRGFGQEPDIDPAWPPGLHDSRMIQTPLISVMWSVMSVRSGQDPYVAADLSNADGQMGGIFPLHPIPPRTGSPEDPVLLPVTIDGSAGAEAKLRIRRFWSAESGLE